jgi:hypothetical protein
VAKSALTVTAPNILGNYTIVVLGVTSAHGKTSYASSMLTVQVISSQDFTITSSPSSITNLVGSTNTTTITVTSINGYNGNVSLTATTPFGYISVTGAQSPLMLSPGATASSTLSISTSSSTALGTYSISVTGTAGSRSHTTTVILNVVDPVPVVVESLMMTSHVFNNGTSLTLNLQNIGNGSITLESYIVQDSSGDAWSLMNWAGPTFAAGTVESANILIGSSCPSCIYTGITGLFFQFQAGQTYTVTVTTVRNHQFSFTVTR